MADSDGDSEIRARLAGYFEKLYCADPPDREFPEDADAVQDADTPVSCDPSTQEKLRVQ